MRFVPVAATAALALALATAAPAPASAHPGVVCVFAGARVHLDKPLFYPVLGPVRTNVVGRQAAPPCQLDFVLTSASCGNSVGYGAAYDGVSVHNFNWTEAGGAVHFTGELVGSAQWHPNSLLGDSCTTGADDFLLTGSATTV